MTARTAAVSALVVLGMLQASTPFAAPRTTRSSPATASAPGAHVLSGRAASAARVHGPASRVSVPDGAGGLYIAWADIRDGNGDIFVLRVTGAGVPAAGWPSDGVPVCAAPGDQFESVIMPDGSNGVIVAWLDFRDNWKTPDGYAQRINSSGAPQWTPNGVKVIPALGFVDAGVSPDGTGGVLATWSKDGLVDRDIYAARLTSIGALPAGWPASGILVCDAAEDQDAPQVTVGAAGEAIIAWQDGRAGGGATNIYAQRLSPLGAAQWAPNGVQVDASLTNPTEPFVATDAGGGAFVFWLDFGGSDYLVGQHLDAAGTKQWAPGGLGVSGSGIADGLQAGVPDGAGGSILAWSESPGTVPSIRAQRLNSAGAAQWGVSGTSVVSLANTNPNLWDIVPTGTGGAYFIWEDSRAANFADTPDIYAQLVNTTGVVQWTPNGLGVCTSAAAQGGPVGALDVSGGLLVAWQDQRFFDIDIFVQRYTTMAVPTFGANGQAVFSNPGVQVGSLVLQSDQGGAFVFWNDKRNGQYDIRARKFNDDGTPAGVSVSICAAAGHQNLNDIIDDGTGGAIVVWQDRRGASTDLYAQRVDISCAPQWTANGVPVCTAAGEQQLARMISDSPGTAILAWQDDRNAGNPDIYAQRLNTAGAAQWTANGKPACTNASAQTGAVIASDAAGGAIIAWSDQRNLFTPAIYAQQLNSSGDPVWTVDGNNIATFALGSFPRVADAVPGLPGDAIVLINEAVLDLMTGDFTTVLRVQKVNNAGAFQWGAAGSIVCDVASFCSNERMVNDGAGGAYVAWSDGRNDVYDVYLQRVDATGSPPAPWTANGNVVCNATSWQHLTSLMRDTGGDAYLTWYDARGGQPDIYAQRVNLAGASQWTANGKAVCAAARGQYFSGMAPYKAAVPGRVMVAWTDNRDNPERYVFVQRLELLNGNFQWLANGLTGTTLALVSASAETDRVRLVWFASENVTTTVYRRTVEQDWAPIGEAYPDGGGMIVFEDRDVVPGARYQYRLGFLSDGQETFAGDVWVEVPTHLLLSLEGLQPNPAVKDLLVSFTLPSDAAASLEMIDVSGRRVLARDLRGLPPGRHTLRLDEARPPAGVYFMRLTQRDQSVTTRAAILR